MDATADRFDFAPPHGRRWRGPLVLALVIHGLLVIALTWGITWNQNPQVVAEAELWSALPQVAAPRANEPDEPPPPEVAKPAPPAPEPEVAPPAPPVPQRSQADIALEKKKKEAEQRRREEELQRQRDLEAKKKAELKKQEELKKQREADALAEKKKRDKTAQDKVAKEKADKDKAAKDKALAEQKKKDEALRKAEDARRDAQLEADRKKNLARMMGMAGASGGSTAQGNAAKSSGPSASYAGKVQAAIKANYTAPEEFPAGLEVVAEISVLPDGTITGHTLSKRSGNDKFDKTVSRAIELTRRIPKDENGSIPDRVFVITFKP